MKKLLHLLLTVAGIAALSYEAGAQADYVSSGPYGGAVYSFYRASNRIMASGTGGVYESFNEGKSWREVGPSSSSAAFGCDRIYSTAGQGGVMYAGAYQQGIFYTKNGGSTWALGSGLMTGVDAPYTDIEIIGANVLAIRPDSGLLFMSSDMGVNWMPMSGAINGSFAQYLSVHNQAIFVSTLQGLYRSDNMGMNFTRIDTARANFGRLVWAGDTAYAATASGIKMSLDEGQSFATIALAGRQVRNMAVSGNTIYAVVRNPAPVQDSVLYSTNGGASFTAAPFNANTFRFTTVYDLMPIPSGVLVGTDYGLYSTTSNGNGWSPSDSGYNAVGVRGLAAGGKYIYAAGYPMGVYRVKPDDGNLAWQHSGDMADGITGDVQAIAATGGIVHLGTNSGYFRSADSGATWMTGVPGASNGDVTALYAVAGTTEVWMVRNGNLHFSHDSGMSFGQVVGSNMPSGVLRFVTKADTCVFAASYSTLYKAGASLNFTPVSGLIGIVTGIQFIGGTYYAATAGYGIYTSTDGGNWTQLASTAPLPQKINVLIRDSAGTGLIAGTDNGIYTNSSGSWEAAGLQGRSVQSLVVRNGKLFVGTCSGAYSIPYKIDPPPASVGNTSLAAAGLHIWPNPSKGAFSLRVQAVKNGDGALVVRNMMGAVVFRQALSLKAGVNELYIAAGQQLVPGIYTVQVSGASTHPAARLVIQ